MAASLQGFPFDAVRSGTKPLVEVRPVIVQWRSVEEFRGIRQDFLASQKAYIEAVLDNFFHRGKEKIFGERQTNPEFCELAKISARQSPWCVHAVMPLEVGGTNTADNKLVMLKSDREKWEDAIQEQISELVESRANLQELQVPVPRYRIWLPMLGNQTHLPMMNDHGELVEMSLPLMQSGDQLKRDGFHSLRDALVEDNKHFKAPILLKEAQTDLSDLGAAVSKPNRSEKKRRRLIDKIKDLNPSPVLANASDKEEKHLRDSPLAKPKQHDSHIRDYHKAIKKAQTLANDNKPTHTRIIHHRAVQKPVAASLSIVADAFLKALNAKQQTEAGTIKEDKQISPLATKQEMLVEQFNTVALALSSWREQQKKATSDHGIYVGLKARLVAQLRDPKPVARKNKKPFEAERELITKIQETIIERTKAAEEALTNWETSQHKADSAQQKFATEHLKLGAAVSMFADATPRDKTRLLKELTRFQNLADTITRTREAAKLKNEERGRQIEIHAIREAERLLQAKAIERRSAPTEHKAAPVDHDKAQADLREYRRKHTSSRGSAVHAVPPRRWDQRVYFRRTQTPDPTILNG